ncbi:MAG TPA: ferritin family protein [Terriglobales bacterium]|jgi:rubrerythrin|nr:ferritin family protein [Terriglobales bacterium]
MQRSFASLRPQEVLHIALCIEQRNAGIYHRFAEMFTEFGDPESLEIAAVFWEMAVEEREHHALLERQYIQQYGNPVRSFSEEELVEFIEVPRLEHGDVFGAVDGLAARQAALQVALQAEVSAQLFYTRMTEQTADAALRQTYYNLAQMEDGHVAFLEAKLSQDTTAKPILQ